MTAARSIRRCMAMVTSALAAASLGLAGCHGARDAPAGNANGSSPAGLLRLVAPGLPDMVEVANPLRGGQYGGVVPPTETPPPGYPLTDRYDRFCWTALEPRRGVHDFGQIDIGLAGAQAAGYTFGFRIMPINGRERCTPDYLPRQGDGIIPDFNDPLYLDAAARLFAALGDRYADDPRLGMMDMSLYGCWGEWHESCDRPFTEMTATNRRRLIDLQYAALPHTRFLMLTEHRDSLSYALSAQRELPTGVRVDCLGSADLGGARDGLDDAIVLDRWRVAPTYFEYCSKDIDRPGSTKPDFALAVKDVTRYHASIVGDGLGNLQRFASYGPADRDNLMASFLRSGYRYQLVDVTTPASVTRGRPFALTSQWANLNAAYTYQPWHVTFQLRPAEPADAAVANPFWQATSMLDLREPFAERPTGAERRTVTDRVTVPASVPAGTYQLCVRVSDDGGRALALANADPTSDGAYCLGALTVGG